MHPSLVPQKNPAQNVLPSSQLFLGREERRGRPPRPRVPIGLVVSNSLLREGLARLLEQSHFDVAAAGDSVDALAPAEGRTPQLILIGAAADPDHALRDLEACRTRYRDARTVVFEEHCDGNRSVMMIAAGVDGYFGKAVTIESLLLSLDLVMRGVTVCSSPMQTLVTASARMSGRPAVSVGVQPARAPAHRLSNREIAILRCLVHGASNKIIARRFQIAEGTVKVHVKAILRKIRVANRTQAAIWAMEHLPRQGGETDCGAPGEAVAAAAERSGDIAPDTG